MRTNSGLVHKIIKFCHSVGAIAAITAVAVAAVGDLGHVGGLLDLGLASLSRGSSAVAKKLLLHVDITVLGPLIVVSADLAGVLLVVVLVSLDEIVRLAVSGVSVGTVGLLGERVIVVSTAGSLGTLRGSVVEVASLAVFGLGGTLDTVAEADSATVEAVAANTNAVASAVGEATLATNLEALAVVVASGGTGAGRGSTIDVLVDTPSLSAPLVVISVVPLIVRLGIVGLGPGLLVRLIDLEVLITAISIEISALSVEDSTLCLLGGSVELTTALSVAEAEAVALALGVLPGGGSSTAADRVTLIVDIAVLSPLVIVGLEPPGVLGAIVRAGLHGVVRLAVSGVTVLTVGLLGERVSVVSTTGGLGTLGGTLPVGSAVGTLADTLAVEALALLTVSGTLTVLGSGGLATVRRGTLEVLVDTPSLSSPLVIISVVPLVIRLSSVALSAGVVEGDLLMEVLVAAIGVPVVAGSTPVLVATGLGGIEAVTTLAVEAEKATLATLLSGGSSLAVLIKITTRVVIAVLSPLVVISDDLTLVVLVVERLGLDGVVRPAVSGVEVRALSLLGPLIIIVSLGLSSSLPRGSGGLLGSSLLGTVGLAVRATEVGGVAVERLAVAKAVAEAVDRLAIADLGLAVLAVSLASSSLSSSVVVITRSIVLLRRGTVEIAVLAPSLSGVAVFVLVVPLIEGLSAVRLGAGLAVRLVDGEVLIAAIGIEVRVLGPAVVLTVSLGGSLSRPGGLDNAGLRDVLDLGVATVATEAAATDEAAATIAVANGVNFDGGNDTGEGDKSERFHCSKVL